MPAWSDRPGPWSVTTTSCSRILTSTTPCCRNRAAFSGRASSCACPRARVAGFAGFAGQDTRFRSLYVPNLGNFSSAQLQRVRSRLFKAAGVSMRPPGKRRLYLSRRDAPTRRIIGEGAIESLLMARGFEILTLEGLPLAEQIRLFSEAAVILGPHGAGLSNTLFAPPDCLLLELAPHDQVNHCFWILANALDQPYAYLPAPITDPGSRDMQLSPERLTRFLDDLGIKA